MAVKNKELEMVILDQIKDEIWNLICFSDMHLIFYHLSKKQLPNIKTVDF